MMAVKASLFVAILLAAIVLCASSGGRRELLRAASTPHHRARAPDPPRPARAARRPRGSSDAQSLDAASEDDAGVGQSALSPAATDSEFERSESPAALPSSAVAATPAPASTEGLDPDAIIGGIDTVGSPDDAGQANDALPGAVDSDGNPIDLQRKQLKSLGSLPRRCECTEGEHLEVSDIRQLSDDWMGGGTAENKKGFSNMLWSFGQFIDHDIVGTIEDLEGPSYTIEVAHNNNTGAMVVHRLVAPDDVDGCPAPDNVHTAALDGGPVYGTDAQYLKEMLREPGSCRLRVSGARMLPITSTADSKGRFFFVAGDLRVDEHGLLTCMHTVWMREHNRLCDEIAASGGSKSTDEQFNLARKVVEAKLQQITMTEFLPALGITEVDLKSAPSQPHSSEFVSVEFATAVFRFGHDLVPDHIGDFKTADIFNGQDYFLEHKDGAVALRGDAEDRLRTLLEAASTSLCANRDGMMSDTLRNTLFGSFGHDLASLNIFRARDLHVPDYGDLARCFGASPNKEIAEQVGDAFVALLQEEDHDAASIIGSTTRAIFLEQFKAIFFGPEGLWWGHSTADLGTYADEVEATTLGKVIQANTDASVASDVFKV